MGIRFKHSQRRSLPRGQNPRASVGFAHLLVDATLTQSAAAHHPRGFCFCRMRRPVHIGAAGHGIWKPWRLLTHGATRDSDRRENSKGGVLLWGFRLWRKSTTKTKTKT
ncbi:uncharacterized protein [Physcomitrium patens]|uniref:uncharacterized protein isoform X2 n=1 Tax=Physcomitrium patens TaxID=3218 RepID=UPI003CCCEDC3